jgi:ADP-heptose:LPS heptosyltransferase
VAWHSFYFGAEEEPPFPGITPLAPLLSNFSDSAFALDAMDLVITVDTALAHLAGALGVPTLLLLHAFPDWRWLLGREDSPWYPTLRIYRQPMQGDWETVVQCVLADLTTQESGHQTM